MPKLKPDTQRARRDHILDAASACFGRQGFHRTTVQDICREAALSPGALYVYFNSKEALIAGLCERDRAAFAQRFADMAAAPDFFEALRELGRHYFEDDPVERQRVAIDMGLEATRNTRIAEIYGSVDDFCLSSFEQLFTRLEKEGRIKPDVDVATLARVFQIMGDGLFWRRATDTNFDAERVVPVMIRLLAILMKPIEQAPPKAKPRKRPSRAKPKSRSGRKG
jgi:AcrR family transcriptional regulator